MNKLSIRLSHRVFHTFVYDTKIENGNGECVTDKQADQRADNRPFIWSTQHL